ncbi:hypothetical protein E05_02750 [Plautia stali symbiont]|nr:hypothetical protein E05_02750 [Plautia stali symbiont]
MPAGGEFASGSHISMIAAKKMAGKEKGAAAPEGLNSVYMQGSGWSAAIYLAPPRGGKTLAPHRL